MLPDRPVAALPMSASTPPAADALLNFTSTEKGIAVLVSCWLEETYPVEPSGVSPVSASVVDPSEPAVSMVTPLITDPVLAPAALASLTDASEGSSKRKKVLGLSAATVE